jgi:hypothetical protein
MKKWSRKKKLLFCTVLLLISLFFITSITNWPSPTLEIAIARKEKQQLVGPSEIIGQIEYDYGQIYLGKTDHGFTTFEYTEDLGWDHGELRYFPKGDTATVFCTDFLLWLENERWLPVMVFPQNSKSASASMTLCVTGSESQQSYQLEATRQDDGYFLFSLPLEDHSGELFWLLQQAITGSWQEYVVTGTVEIQIDFYDHSGNLVDSYCKTVTK